MEMNNKPGAGLVALASEGSMPDAGRNMPWHAMGVNRLFGCFSYPLYGGGTIPAVCGFSSDLDQKGAVLWSKSEDETPETPETLETPGTLCVDAGIAFL